MKAKVLCCLLMAFVMNAHGQAIPPPLPLHLSPGDAIKGRSIVSNRQVGLCLLCHSAPIPEERFQGNIAPSLAGVGARWNIDELRQRVAYSRSINPQSVMPDYLQTDNLNRVAPTHQGKSILTAQQVEDVVAFLATLKD
jgi:L-cysteine S-thiosulfotransferase